MNGGKCGICGDPWNGPKENEAPGGIYATGTIVAQYTEGQAIDIDVRITLVYPVVVLFRSLPWRAGAWPSVNNTSVVSHGKHSDQLKRFSKQLNNCSQRDVKPAILL